MAQKIFVNLPVRDLKKSVCFLPACETDGVELSRCSPYTRTRSAARRRVEEPIPRNIRAKCV